MMFANANCDHIVIENPVGVMSSEWRKPDQIINPYQFGDPYEKKTCLWLKGLPPLKPTNVVKPEPRKKYKSGKTIPAWYADAWKLPKDERAKLRSKTFPGIAQALAVQFTAFIESKYSLNEWNDLPISEKNRNNNALGGFVKPLII